MPTPIRVLHVVDNLGSGGLENGLANVIEQLDPDAFEHVVCAVRMLGANASRLARKNVNIICLNKQAGDSRFQVPSLARVIRQHAPHVVHSRNWSGAEAVIAGRLVGSCKLIHSEHGLDSVTPGAEPLRRVLFRRAIFELAHRVLTVSQQLRDVHARRTGFRADRISVIHNGVDNRRFYPDPDARGRLRAELSIAGNEFCIGCVGNCFPVKDQMTLLRAVRLAPPGAPWRVLLIGDGPERTKLQEFVSADPGLSERVSFLGSSPRVPELLNAMDVYALPSITEGISNSLLEAMATGLPVIVTATGGNPEVVVGGESGLLFPVGDAQALCDHLLELQSRQDQRERLASGALARVRDEFSIEAMIRNYDSLYRGVRPAVNAAVRSLAGA